MIKEIEIIKDLTDDSNGLCTIYSMINALRTYFFNKEHKLINFDLKKLVTSFFDIAKEQKDSDALFYYSCDFSFLSKFSDYLCFETTSTQNNLTNKELNKFKISNFITFFEKKICPKHESKFNDLIKNCNLVGNDIYGKTIKLSHKKNKN